MLWIVIITGTLYFALISCFFYGWETLPVFRPSARNCSTSITIIVAMRNEEESIANLLQDLVSQNYPEELLEVIVVDDHSADQSSHIASGLMKAKWKVLSLPDGLMGKKAAIHYGMEASVGDLIITTDADCRMGQGWIKSIAEYYEQYHPVLVLAPVVASKPVGVWSEALALELYSLLGSTAGSASIGYPVMCNGANMAISREVLPVLEEVYHNMDVRSGDDMFTLMKLHAKYPERVHYMKCVEATVFTALAKDLPSFFRQRKRWAAKAKFYKDWSVLGTAILVFGINLLLLVTLVAGIVQSDTRLFVSLLVIKSAIDFMFLFRITTFFGERRLLGWFSLVQSFYFLYVCFSVLGGLLFHTNWKDRTIKQ